MPNLKEGNVQFHVTGASGYSCKSFITKAGGATGVLRISVIDNKLHLWASPVFKLFGRLYDLIHEIPLNQIEKAEKDGEKITLTFKASGKTKQFVIRRMNKQEEFLNVIKFKSN